MSQTRTSGPPLSQVQASSPALSEPAQTIASLIPSAAVEFQGHKFRGRYLIRDAPGFAGPLPQPGRKTGLWIPGRSRLGWAKGLTGDR
jgi:hypothetical protein